MSGHPVGHLFRIQENRSEAITTQRLTFFFALDVQDDLNLRIERTRGADHLTQIERIGDGDHQHGGSGNVRLDAEKSVMFP